jgi:hypothetical protein
VNPLCTVVAARAGHRCEYCRAPEAVYNFPFEVQHFLPKSEGGLTILENLALSCHSCNVYKSANTQGVDPVTNESVRLFHPRLDNWTEHFYVNLDLQIVGKTSIGRATIDCLRLNSPKQISSRRKWKLFRMFP